MNPSEFLKAYGPWAVVTGASGGIGREFAHALAARGLNVVLVARTQATLESLAEAIRGEHDVEAVAVAADLSRAGDVHRVCDAALEREVGLLVANAGFGTSGDFVEASLDAELEMLDLNCRALMVMSSRFGRRFVEQGRGGVVVLSSVVGFQGVPHAAHYAATKAYVQTLGEGIRVELRPHGVDVLCVAPGPVETDFAARADLQMGGATSPAVVAERALRSLGRDSTVRPGWRCKLLGHSLGLLPRWGRVGIMNAVMGSMTRHQRTGDSRNS